MPSYWTHLAFAHDASREIFTLIPKGYRGELISAIAAQPHLFCSGTQGPDPFLFYLPVYLGKDKLPTILHTQKTPQLLSSMLRRAYQMKGEQRIMALSYTAGFLAHYALDSHAHAYVYSKTGADGGADSFCNHNALESDLNGLSIRRSFHRTAREMPPPRGYELSASERSVVSSLYAYLLRNLYGLDCTEKEVRHAILSARTCYRILYDPTSRKGKLTRRIEAHLARPYLSPIFLGESHYYDDPANLSHSPWKNPFTGEVSTADFFSLYDLALEHYIPLICALDAMGAADPMQTKAILQTFATTDFKGEPIQS